ncbi:Fic family protein [Klebsiella quasivariicola]|uniref:Filamentation induced by cAMP protein Fic n=1 Tax=Klebsiella quasivariicola TaxID=2026240 RepID=A0A8B4TTR5_9ENTR|nr:Fic family protein [Klebsiella quasivariicola]QBL47619.1 Fic family protein [Klebsiella sp. PO552]NBZ74361.1 HTH domain-containing protein [Klebsiella quasivariicola]TTN51435.1 Fic family protein [Klebsiella quasivariicola]SLY35981.1 filamentation induced by cAMP protein Fic [Klebsiella quasivariicola]
MSRYQPPFSITPTVLNLVVEIGELLGHWSAKRGQTSPLLRKENRIRTIQASLAIEHNSLSMEQVTALLEGKRVLAPAKDIQEVRNAIRAYELMPGWHAANISDLLAAHKTLMVGLVDSPGVLRGGNVGIYRGTQVVHMAPPAALVPRLIADLLNWLEHTELHPLIASSVFHYEFEFIHPFADGNGRMGRLWQTLILSQWRQELAWLPVETLIHHQQERYYDILGVCDKTSDCTLFVTWMLQNILAALKEGLETSFVVSEEMSEEMSEEIDAKLTELETTILHLLTAAPDLTARALAENIGISARTVERYLQGLQAKGRLIRIGAKKGGSWLVK